MWNRSQHAPHRAVPFKNDLISTFLYDGIIILQPSQAAKKLADQSSSPPPPRLLTLFYHTLWLLYSSIPAVGEGDRKTCSPSFPQNQTNCGDKPTTVLTVREGLHHSHFAFGSRYKLIWSPLHNSNGDDSLWWPLAAHSRLCISACDRVPHCCSDVSSLCPPSHDRHTHSAATLLGDWGVWASLSICCSSSHNPLSLFCIQQPPPPPPPAPKVKCWVLLTSQRCCWPTAN